MQLPTNGLLVQKRLQQLLGPPGTRDSPPYSDRSEDCHFASPTLTQLDRAQEQGDPEQNHTGGGSTEGPDVGGKSHGLRMTPSPSPYFGLQFQGRDSDSDGGQEREASDKHVSSSLVTDRAQSDLKKVNLPSLKSNFCRF